MIEFKNVDFTYQNALNGAGVHDVTITIPQGQVVLLCGGSGCGKTTLTRMINGLIPHFYEGELNGDITVCGLSVKEHALHEIAPFVGSVFQNPKSQFYTVKTDTEIVFGCENVGMSKENIFSNFENTVKELNVTPLLGKSLFSLSGGEKQKIACASVAALMPSVIVMDEPTSNLDMKTIWDLKEIIRKWKQSGKTVIIAEHRLYWLMDLADRVLYMKDGRIMQDISIREFRSYSAEKFHQLGLRTASGLPQAGEQEASNMQERSHNSSHAEFIQFDHFCFSYQSAKNYTMCIDTLSIPKGVVVGVIGNNGAGKTTFGRCLCGLEKGVKGTVSLENSLLNRKQRIRLSYIVMQDVNHQLFTESVFDEILLSMENQPDTQEQKEQRACEILQQLRLEPFKDCHPMSLSGGQKQRVAIAGALASNKKILVYDEPTSGLDYQHMLDVADAVNQMKKADNTQFIITHDAELVTQCCDYILFMQKGKVVKHGYLSEETIYTAVRDFFESI